MKKLSIIALLLVVFAFCGCGKKEDPAINAQNQVVYAQTIAFNSNNFNCYVGDSFNISNFTLNITPSNVTVSPSFTVNNTEIATIENNVVTFNKVGSVTLTASILSDVNTYKTAYLTFIVETRPVYVSSFSFENANIVLNYDETLTNALTVAPANHNQNIEVVYSCENVVNYNYLTGVITPINPGESTVTVKSKSSKTETITSTFNVVVTNKIYATDLSDIKINNKSTQEELVTLFCGDEGKITYTVSPSNYNMPVTFRTENNKITINNEGEFVTTNLTGSEILYVDVQTKTGIIIKQINCFIINCDATLDFNVVYNNEIVNNVYCGYNYYAIINTEGINYGDVVFAGCEFEYVSDNKFLLTFTNPTQSTINATYTYNGFINNKTITGSKTLSVYNAITDVNFALTNNNVELIPNNNVYTIYLPNYSNLNDDLTNVTELIYATLNFSAKGLNVNSSALSVKLEGTSVKLENNLIIPLNVGDSKLIIESSDVYGFKKEVTISVAPLTVATINVETDVVNLFLNGDTLKPNKHKIQYSVTPSYAYNTNVEISTNSNLITISNGVVTAVNEGEAIVTLTCGNVTKNITYSISYVPTSICAFIDGSKVVNGSTINFDVNKNYYLTANVLSGETLIKDFANVKLNGEELLLATSHKLSFKSEGTNVVLITFDNLNFTFNIVASYKPTHIKCYINNLLVDASSNVNLTAKQNYTFKTEVYSDDVLISNNTTVLINSNELQQSAEYTLCFNEAGSNKINVTYENLEVTFNVDVELVNPILTFEFNNSSYEVNRYFTSELPLEYQITKQYEEEQFTDQLTFESSNSTIATIVNNKVNILSDGEVEIIAKINGTQVDSFSISVYFKEILYINSLSDFKNINADKCYVVNCDLDFSEFSSSDAKSFNGEIDFNNKKLTNVKTLLFSNLGASAIVENIVIEGNITVDSNSAYSVITSTNYGTINNLTFNNNIFTFTDTLQTSTLNSYLICNLNYGVISNVNYVNTKLTTPCVFNSYPNMVMSAGVCNNLGTISSILGDITFENFTRAGGLAINNHNTIENVNLNVTFTCGQTKQQVGGLVYELSVGYLSDSTTVSPKLKNIELNYKLYHNNATVNAASLCYKDTYGTTVDESVKINVISEGESLL